VYTATTPKSKSLRSPRPDCSVAFAVKPECELVFVRVGRVPSDHVVPAAVRSDLVPMVRGARNRARQELNPNLDETAKRLRLVVHPRVP
jgi:hypothetical protein